MYSKIEITGNIEVITGMHIGDSTAFAAIGAVDSPVVKDVRNGEPIIPGSSLKGKLRTLLARQYNESIVNHNEDDERIVRLFGCANAKSVKRSRLIFTDMRMVNANELREQGITGLTEVKFENSINRCTSVANPRQIERVIRGSLFEFSVIYEAEKTEEILDDIKMLCQGMKLLRYDYLGGNGSRGYGKVKFRDLDAEVVVGEIEDDIMEQCILELKEV